MSHDHSRAQVTTTWAHDLSDGVGRRATIEAIVDLCPEYGRPPQDDVRAATIGH